jgi:hypothetical protein
MKASLAPGVAAQFLITVDARDICLHCTRHWPSDLSASPADLVRQGLGIEGASISHRPGAAAGEPVGLGVSEELTSAGASSEPTAF